MSAPKKKAALATRRPPTMQDVARAVGLHQTTISLALRNQPGIPVATRERVRAIADRLGYRPDPAIDAFNFHRIARQPLRSAPPLALVADARSWAEFAESAARRELLAGVQAAAGRLGFVLQRFLVGRGQLSPARLAQILRARGVGNVIVAPLSVATSELALDWPRLCAVSVESFHLRPALDAIAPNHRVAATRAVEELRKLGHRRVGLVLRAHEDQRLSNVARAGFLTAQSCAGETAPVPPLLLAPRESPAGPVVTEWLRAHRVEAVLVADASWCADLAAAAGAAGVATPALACLDLAGAPPEIAGIDLGHERLGEYVVESMAIRRQANRRGVPDSPAVTLLPVVWRAGASAMRAPGVAQRKAKTGPGPGK